MPVQLGKACLSSLELLVMRGNFIMLPTITEANAYLQVA